MTRRPRDVPRLEFVRTLLPHMADEELREQEEHVWRYFDVIRRIAAYADFEQRSDSTKSGSDSRL